MKEIDDRLRELAQAVRDWDADGSLATTTLRSIKRRRRATSVAGGLAVSFLGLGTAIGIMNLPVKLASSATKISPAQSSSSLPTAEQPSPSERIKLDGFGAVWPEDTADETAEACSEAASTPGSFRTDALSTAVEFGRVMLGWDGIGVTRNERKHSVEVDLWRDEGVVGNEAGPGVVLTMVEYLNGCWSVQSVGVLSDTHTSTMTDRDVADDGTSSLSVAFDPRSNTGTVEMGYGSQLETKRWDATVDLDNPVTFQLDPVDPRDGGHFLILFEDDQGEVITATGAALPAAHVPGSRR